MRDTARIIVSKSCPKSCSYCCNKQCEEIETKPVSLEQVPHHRAYAISGGEPLSEANAYATLKVVETVAERPETEAVYLYTASHHYNLLSMLPDLDGITYTVHEDSRYSDRVSFERVQALLKAQGPHMERRLQIHIDAGITVPVDAEVWESVEIVHWEPGVACPVPENETVYVLGG